MPVVPGPPTPSPTADGPPTGPCGAWTTDELVRACCAGLDPAYDLTNAIAYASEILYALSGRKYPGLCERLVWPPCARCCAGDAWWAFPASDWNWRTGSGLPSIPYTYDGAWRNCWQCNGDGCDADCGMDCLLLPGPIASIEEVVIDGVALDPAAYVVNAYRYLCRVDGEQWPLQNTYTDPYTPGSEGWYIRYHQGQLPPTSGVMAASIFACQIAKNLCGAEDCVLPQRLKQITREGVEMDFADPLTFLDEGKVGIYEVDLFLSAVNPRRLARRGRMYRADSTPPPRSFSEF